MKTTTIYKDDKTHVVRFDISGKFLYTRTYIYDDEGFVEKSIIVTRDGKVIEQ